MSGRCACGRPSRSSARLFDASLAGKDVKHDGKYFKARDDPAVDDARAGPADHGRHRRADQRQEDREVRRRDDHGRRSAGEDRWPLRPVRRGRPRGRQGPGRDAQGAAACTCRGPRPTRRRSRTR
nr:hypothetical protein [Angustibacter aerolatus]